MRNSYIVKIITGVFIAAVGLAACKTKGGVAPHNSMELVADSSITHLTQPVNAQVVATIPVISPETGSRIYSAAANGVITYDTRQQTAVASRVGGRIERLLIKYNYQPVKKGQLIMEIYSPDLAAAQRELIYVAQSSKELLAGARQRLQLLGMQPGQIDQVLKTGNILYRIPVYSNSDGYILEKSAAVATASAAPPVATSAGDGMSGMGSAAAPVTSAPAAPAATPVLLREGQYVTAGQPLFTIYQADALVAVFSFPPQLAATIRKGQRLLFYPTEDNTAMQTGIIGLIEPVFRNGENFTLARIYLNKHHFRAGQLLTASIPVMYSNGSWLPKKAVWRLGNKAVVFKKEKEVYVPQVVQTGVEEKDMIQVITDIADWKVASNAAYLVDSESFIKTKQ
ncbi:efflux RND transporter periplasmic adaptor subunit [Chitinophaga sp. 22321]|uniref:Efflux RND transporter periplasmic adaptor subunit n=1 Tax=Chitinophaga hostae TaxID=2831022 RepID=A0ABS5J665_9BACT|nr:efflux RND transporter periplasmic adaptor subunit [Chitinophaga hostae]MBS0030062.1 efflux RND transporter periplasmic adaptor subunit [Chitinophaga hostae]